MLIVLEEEQVGQFIAIDASVSIAFYRVEEFDRGTVMQKKLIMMRNKKAKNWNINFRSQSFYYQLIGGN